MEAQEVLLERQNGAYLAPGHESRERGESEQGKLLGPESPRLRLAEEVELYCGWWTPAWVGWRLMSFWFPLNTSPCAHS